MEAIGPEVLLSKGVKEGGEEAVEIDGKRSENKDHHQEAGVKSSSSSTDSLVPTPILAVAANQKFRACVNENTLARDPFLAVSHLWWGSCVNFIDTG